MTFTFGLRLSTAALALMGGLGAGPAAAGDPGAHGGLHLVFSGLQGQGEVDAAIFADAAAWASKRGAARVLKLPVADGRVDALVTDLPPGRYAVMAYQDMNGNGRFDFTPMLREPYGFSNNARGVFSPPSWTAAVFDLAAGRTAEQAIRLHVP